MKALKKIAKILTSILAVVAIILWFFYEKDLPMSELKAKYTDTQSRFVEIDGMQVHYKIEGQGTPLLLIHGTGAMLHTWDQWATLLKDKFQIVRMEIPGFGLTGPRADGVYTTDMYVDFMEKFRQKIAIDSFHLAGNSLGGLIAWRYALAHPQHVKKLVLLDPAGFHDHNQKGGSFLFNMARDYPALTKVFLKIGTSYFTRKTLKEVYYDKNIVTDSLVLAYNDMARRQGNRMAFVDRCQKATEKYDPAILKGISNPTLVLWGKEDLLIDVREAEYFRNIPNSTFILYDKVGHVPQEEIPAKSAQDMAAWLGN